MSDDLTYADAPSGVPSGSKIATDDVGGAHYQRVKLDVGGDGASSPVVDALTVIPGSGEKVMGFGGIVEEALSDTSLDAGTNTLGGTTVPSGEIHVITQVVAQYIGTVPTQTFIFAVGLAGDIVVLDQASPTSGIYYPATVNVILQSGDEMRCRVNGATAGDDLFFRYAGYKFDAP